MLSEGKAEAGTADCTDGIELTGLDRGAPISWEIGADEIGTDEIGADKMGADEVVAGIAVDCWRKERVVAVWATPAAAALVEARVVEGIVPTFASCVRDFPESRAFPLEVRINEDASPLRGAV